MDARRTRAEVVRDRESAAPGFGSDRSSEIREQRLRIPIRDRKHGELHDGLGLAEREAFRAGFGSPTRRQRVAGVERQVEYAAALDALGRAIRAVGIDVALEVAVVARIGIDDAADGAALMRNRGGGADRAE